MEGDLKGVRCCCYFKGRDGLGTCNTGCQWYRKDGFCPQWIPVEHWDTDKDFHPDKESKLSTLEQYEKWSGIDVEVEGSAP